LPEEWLTDAARARAHIPSAVFFRQRWRLALTLLRQVRASGFAIKGVLADAEFGDNRMFRNMLHRLRLPYAVGVSSHLTAFRGTPRVQMSRPAHGRRKHPRVIGGVTARPIAEVIGAASERWRRVRWRNRRGGHQWTTHCVAIRVTPAVDHRHPRLSPELWLLAERDVGQRSKTKFHFVNLPSTASLSEIVRLAHQRWAIEQQYQELKTELGLDHFEGRTFPGWHHHVVLTAVAYNFLQTERQRTRVHLTFPQVRGVVQEIFTAYLFAQRPHYLKRIEALRSVQLRI
jgi:SRSO17 transposase